MQIGIVIGQTVRYSIAQNQLLMCSMKSYNCILRKILKLSHSLKLAVLHIIKEIHTSVDAMVQARAKANEIQCEYEKALAYHEIADSLFGIRKFIDQLEEICDNSTWPLPKYREILFIN